MPKLTLWMNSLAHYTLSPSFSDQSIEIHKTAYLTRDIFVISFPKTYPSPLFSFGLFLFSLLSIFLISRINMLRPVALWLMFVSSINLVSSVFFILFPSLFPYESKQFSEFYILTVVNIWIFIPLISGMALLPLPAGVLSKFAISFLTLVYSVCFGIIRYVVFLNIIAKISFLFITMLVFVFGPLVDFFYVVGIYSVYLSKISRKVRTDPKTWRWSF